MPRNPNKRRCQTPGCKAYAMRNLGGGKSKPGHLQNGPSWSSAPANHCRSHLDHVLGPRRVGAPKGNLNAIKTGRHAHPIATDKLDLIAHEIAKDSAQTPAIISRELYALQDRTGDAYFTLLLLSRMVRHLIPLVTDQIFHIELYQFLEKVPPVSRPKLEAQIWQQTLPLVPLERLTTLRKIEKHFTSEINNRDKEPGAHSSDFPPGSLPGSYSRSQVPIPSDIQSLLRELVEKKC